MQSQGLQKLVTKIIRCNHEQISIIKQELEQALDATDHLTRLEQREKRLIKQALKAYQGHTGPSEAFLFFNAVCENQHWVVRLHADRMGRKMHYEAEVYPCITLHS